MPPLEHDSTETDTDDTEYKETGDNDNPNIWIEDINSHNTEIENLIQAAFALSIKDSPDEMEQLPQWSQEGCEGEQRDRRTRQPRR